MTNALVHFALVNSEKSKNPTYTKYNRVLIVSWEKAEYKDSSILNLYDLLILRNHQDFQNLEKLKDFVNYPTFEKLHI